MGSGASISTDSSLDNTIQIVQLNKLPDAIEESVFVYEKFPLIIDPTEQSSRFLKYQMGSYINNDDPIQMDMKNLNRCLVGALRYGRTMTLKFNTLENVVEDKVFMDKMFPKTILQREKFYKDENWQSILKPDLGDDLSEITICQEFVFIICTKEEYIPPYLGNMMHVIKVIDKLNDGNDKDKEEDPMEAIAALYGAKEVVRNSQQLVEAAFDGDLDEIKNWIEKGYHIESTDGRKHTALSEAACQGHLHVVTFLLDSGADPNALSDTGRSSIWRASFNGHLEVVKVLLESGADPDFRDKVSIESAYDIAQNEGIRNLLNSWDKKKTEALKEKRRREILLKIEERIKTSAEREQFARAKIRQELVQKAEQGDVEGIKVMLKMIADEAEKTGTKPRATAEVRNENGQSLLSIAAQHDYEELALFLLTYYKECDKDRWDLAEGEFSIESQVFKTNPNTRDLKGWTCVSIAVFHESKKVLALLLNHGGDPNIRSSYNKNAYDLAKDELDAANHVIKSKEEIRQVLIDNDQTNNANAIFGRGNAEPVKGNSDLYKDLGPDGSPIVMNIEMNNENLQKESDKKGKGKGGQSSKKGGGQSTKKKK